MITTDPNDPYLQELQMDRGQAIWIAELSSGTKVYSDDFRPGVSPWSTWERLGVHCKSNKLHVKNLTLKFRSHEIDLALPADSDGVFLCRGMQQVLMSSSKTDFLVVGNVYQNTVQTTKYQLPILKVVSSGERPLFKCPPQCLIMRPPDVKEEMDR